MVFFPWQSQATRIEGDAECSLSFGRCVPETAARRIAETSAWLDALEKATNTLSTAGLVRWTTQAVFHRQALVSAVVMPAVRSTSKEEQVSVHVRLSTPQRTADDRLRKIVHEQEMLQLRVEMLKLEKTQVEEARTLIQLALASRRNWDQENSEDKKRIVLLAEHLEALWQLGRILPQREGGRWHDPQEALPVMQQAAALNPDYAPLQYLLGEILLQLDRPQDALAVLDKALALNPELAGALYVRGLAYLRLQLPTLAERDFSAALLRDASHAAWWRARGALRMIRHEIAPMCEDFTHACAIGDCEGLTNARERGLCLTEK